MGGAPAWASSTREALRDASSSMDRDELAAAQTPKAPIPLLVRAYEGFRERGRSRRAMALRTARRGGGAVRDRSNRRSRPRDLPGPWCAAPGGHVNRELLASRLRFDAPAWSRAAAHAGASRAARVGLGGTPMETVYPRRLRRAARAPAKATGSALSEFRSEMGARRARPSDRRVAHPQKRRGTCRKRGCHAHRRRPQTST